MTLKHTIKTAFVGLKTNRSRSALTILGIVIGITAIMLVMSVGAGGEALILNQVRGLGSTTLIVEPGREPRGPSDFVEVFTDSLKARDLEAIKKKANVAGLLDAEPVVFQVTSVNYGYETKRTIVRGGTWLFASIIGLYPAFGTFYTNDDIRQRAAVAVIGAEVKDELFGAGEAIGKKIKIKDKLFRVIGILPRTGRLAFFDPDTIVMVPYTTAQDYLFGLDHFNAIVVQAESEARVPQVVRDIELTLRENHQISDPEKDDFHVTTQQDVVNRIGAISTILSVLLVSIAAISLVVGGIGIMNIMLVSVTERTREIGLRKALGATNRDIRRQFLLEAIMLTALGGLVGITLGALLSFAASLILSRVVGLDWHFTFPLGAALLGLATAAVIGLVFGLYPARAAARKDPIEALRYE